MKAICYRKDAGQPRKTRETNQCQERKRGQGGHKQGDGEAVSPNDTVLCTQCSLDVITVVIWWVVSGQLLMTNAARWNWKRHWCQAALEYRLEHRWQQTHGAATTSCLISTNPDCNWSHRHALMSLNAEEQKREIHHFWHPVTQKLRALIILLMRRRMVLIVSYSCYETVLGSAPRGSAIKTYKELI